MYLFIVDKLASPLPQAAHIGVSWAQGAAQTNQEAKNQQEGGARRYWHGPGGEERTDT